MLCILNFSQYLSWQVDATEDVAQHRKLAILAKFESTVVLLTTLTNAASIPHTGHPLSPGLLRPFPDQAGAEYRVHAGCRASAAS